MQHEYKTRGVCASKILFDLDGDTVKNIRFVGGCTGGVIGVFRWLYDHGNAWIVAALRHGADNLTTALIVFGTLILLALVVALAAVSVTTVAKLSSVNSRNIAMMQEQCRDAVALSTTLSRTASSSSAATVGKIRADVHAIDVINQMKMLQDGTNHAYVSTELISRIYTILDAYSNQLITGMSTMEEQTNLSAALQELSAALSGL